MTVPLIEKISLGNSTKVLFHGNKLKMNCVIAMLQKFFKRLRMEGCVEEKKMDRSFHEVSENL